ncbi:hypothetical protein HDU97_000179 [Phlyctochytrium planicorne]|nr:hypothetical protein HDU97_000179 [Phlyctochytrium planicorne]
MQPASSLPPEDIQGQKKSNKKLKISDVRISVPSSVQAFAKFYNSTLIQEHDPYDRIAQDILKRLEHMVFSSLIKDPLRNGSTCASASSCHNDLDNSGKLSTSKKTKRYCAQARRSLLALSRIRSREVRDKCLDLLLEALDVNSLESDDAEVANLLLFVNEITDVLEIAIIQRRRRKRQGKHVNEKADHFVLIDDYIEKLLMIQWLTSTRVEAEELMASPVALSLLSQITRMTPPQDILSLEEPFLGILADLREKKEWYLGRKFIKLLAASAHFNHDACSMFLSLIKRLEDSSWEWIYLGILSITSIVLTSPFAMVRKLALEKGLLAIVERTRNADESTDAWKIRSAALLATYQIYSYRKSDPLSLVALQYLKDQPDLDASPFIRSQFVRTTEGSVPHGRLFFLFKYVCVALAESYSASQSRYIFLRKYLKTTDRKLEPSKRQSSCHIPKRVPKQLRHPKNGKSKRFWNDQRDGKGLEEVEKLDAVLAPQKADLDALSDKPYHDNFKHIAKEVVSPSNGADTVGYLSIKTKPSVLAANYLLQEEAKIFHPPNPPNGTVNRRKLFDAVAVKGQNVANSFPKALPPMPPISIPAVPSL